jgi:hypothetical protein
MTIEQMIDKAQIHCLANYHGGVDSEMLFSRYAQEQKGMNEEQADLFAASVLSDSPFHPSLEDFYNNTSAEYNQFYTWYYLNIVLCEIADLVDENTISIMEHGHGEVREFVILEDTEVLEDNDDQNELVTVKYNGWHNKLEIALGIN